MIGIASLVGVNTFLSPVKKAGVVTVGVSQIGRYDLLTQLPSLDPRIENDPDYEAFASPGSAASGDSVPDGRLYDFARWKRFHLRAKYQNRLVSVELREAFGDVIYEATN